MTKTLRIGTRVDLPEGEWKSGDDFPTELTQKLYSNFQKCLPLRKIVASYLAQTWKRDTTLKVANPEWRNVSSVGELVGPNQLAISAPIVFVGEVAEKQFDAFYDPQYEVICESIDRALEVIYQISNFGHIVRNDDKGKLTVNGKRYSLTKLTEHLMSALKKKEGLEFYISYGDQATTFTVEKSVDKVLKGTESVGRIARVVSWGSGKEWVELEFPDLAEKMVRAKCQIPGDMVELFHNHSDRHFDVHLQVFRPSYSPMGERPAYYYILEADVFVNGLSLADFNGDLDNTLSKWFDCPGSSVGLGKQCELI